MHSMASHVLPKNTVPNHVRSDAPDHCPCQLGPGSCLQAVVSPPKSGAVPPEVNPVSPLLVVLDLDETLVHTHADADDIRDFTILIPGHESLYVIKRPGVDEFLDWLRKPPMEVVVFTAGSESYANAVVRYLDPERTVIRRLLSRGKCSPTPLEDAFCKDLHKLTENMARIVLVDNSPLSCMLQPENGILIDDWLGGDPNDSELERVRRVLEACLYADDVRKVLPRYCERIQPIINSVFMANWTQISLTRCSLSTSTTSFSRGLVEIASPWLACVSGGDDSLRQRNEFVVAHAALGDDSAWASGEPFEVTGGSSEEDRQGFEDDFDVDFLLEQRESKEFLAKQEKLSCSDTREDESEVYRSPPPISFLVPRFRAVACRGDSGDICMPVLDTEGQRTSAAGEADDGRQPRASDAPTSSRKTSRTCDFSESSEGSERLDQCELVPQDTRPEDGHLEVLCQIEELWHDDGFHERLTEEVQTEVDAAPTGQAQRADVKPSGASPVDLASPRVPQSDLQARLEELYHRYMFGDGQISLGGMEPGSTCTRGSELVEPWTSSTSPCSSRDFRAIEQSVPWKPTVQIHAGVVSCEENESGEPCGEPFVPRELPADATSSSVSPTCVEDRVEGQPEADSTRLQVPEVPQSPTSPQEEFRERLGDLLKRHDVHLPARPVEQAGQCPAQSPGDDFRERLNELCRRHVTTRSVDMVRESQASAHPRDHNLAGGSAENRSNVVGKVRPQIDGHLVKPVPQLTTPAVDVHSRLEELCRKYEP